MGLPSRLLSVSFWDDFPFPLSSFPFPLFVPIVLSFLPLVDHVITRSRDRTAALGGATPPNPRLRRTSKASLEVSCCRATQSSTSLSLISSSCSLAHRRTS
eukprot:5950885-Amphidinium_carterae.1